MNVTINLKEKSTYHHTEDQLQQELQVILLAQKNASAFEPLYNKYFEQIYRYCYQRLDDEAVAKDICSTVFLKAITNIKKYKYKGVPFGSWLYRIAMSEVYQALKDKNNERTLNIESIPFKELLDENTNDETFDEEEKTRLKKALKTLKKEEIELIQLRFFENRSFRDIADMLVITENNAKVKAHRILAKLKKTYLR